jgi:hypothetical protein
MPSMPPLSDGDFDIVLNAIRPLAPDRGATEPGFGSAA